MTARPGDDHTDETAHPHTTGSPDMTSPDPTSRDVDETIDTAARPAQPLDAPLPYGAGFTDPPGFRYGVSPGDRGLLEPEPAPGVPTATARRERSGSPVLVVAGLLSLGVAVWAILGAPMFTSTVVITAALVLLVLVGLAMVVRR